MGSMSRKIKKASLLICAVVNSVLPILLLSSIAIPLGVVVGANIVCSICMVAFTRSEDIENIIVGSDIPSEPSSDNIPRHSPTS